MEYILIFIAAVFVNNIVLAQFLGICPFLGVSKKVSTALGMTGAVTFVMILATLVTFIVQKTVLDPFGIGFKQTITFILIIAALVQMVEIILKKVSPSLYQALGVFLPLITTNCAVLGVAIMVIQKDFNLLQSLVFAASTAIGFAVAEGKLKVTDKVISFFPNKLPAQVSDNLKEMEIRHLLTMTCGHDTDPSSSIREVEGADWVKEFLAFPVLHKPGEYFQYNSLGTYMLSAIVQKVTGQKVIDYLTPRLFQPLGIEDARWQESPQGINCGGWGLYLKTEDLAKMGQFLLQKGQWEGKQLLPAEWVEKATSAVVPSTPSWVRFEDAPKKLDPKTCDWVHGYGYQFWQCRHNCYRADGANGQ